MGNCNWTDGKTEPEFNVVNNKNKTKKKKGTEYNDTHIGFDETEDEKDNILLELNKDIYKVYERHINQVDDGLQTRTSSLSNKACSYVKIDELPEGGMYEGEISTETEKKQGYGTLIYKDGSIYRGFWKDDCPDGIGIRVFVDLDWYTGQFKLGKMHGQGNYYSKDGSLYKGEWKHNLQNGYGTQTWEDGSEYSGQWKDGKKSGQGKFKWIDGSIYDGQFENDKFGGHGVYKWADGNVYIGKWHNGQMHGSGKYTWQDGKVYTGEFVKDIREGEGTIEWRSGKKYIGMWKNGKQHGNGRLINKDGKAVKGFWENGKKIEA